VALGQVEPDRVGPTIMTGSSECVPELNDL
jgi:hypothetical protein